MFERQGGNMLVKINSGTIARAIIIGLLFLLLWRVRDLFLIVLTAIVIASAIEPATRWFAKFRIRRLAAVLATYIAVATVFLSLVYFILPTVLGDLSNFLSTVPRIIGQVATDQNIGGSSITETTGKLSNFSSGLTASQGVVKNITESLKATPAKDAVTAPAKTSSIVEIVNEFRDALSNFSDSFVRILSLVFGGVFSFIIIVVLSFYFAVQENGIANFLRVIVPLEHEDYVIDLWKRSQRKIGYWMQGQVLLALLVGVLAYLGLTILGTKNALLFSLSAAVFEIIPLFGPVLAALPPVAASFIDGGLTSGLLVAGLFLIIQQFENHLIYPLVVKKIVGVPPILVIIALIAGAELAGFLGIILSVPVAAVLMEYFTDIEKKKHGRSNKIDNLTPKNT